MFDCEVVFISKYAQQTPPDWLDLGKKVIIRSSGIVRGPDRVAAGDIDDVFKEVIPILMEDEDLNLPSIKEQILQNKYRNTYDNLMDEASSTFDILRSFVSNSNFRGFKKEAPNLLNILVKSFIDKTKIVDPAKSTYLSKITDNVNKELKMIARTGIEIMIVKAKAKF